MNNDFKMPVTNEPTYYRKNADGSFTKLGSYENATAAWGRHLLDKLKITPLRMGLYPFAWQKATGANMKEFPEYDEYFGGGE